MTGFLSFSLKKTNIIINNIGTGTNKDDTNSPKNRVLKNRQEAPKKDGNSRYTLESLNDCSAPPTKRVEIIEIFAIIENTNINMIPVK